MNAQVNCRNRPPERAARSSSAITDGPSEWTDELARQHARLGGLLRHLRRLLVANRDEAWDAMLGAAVEQLIVEVRVHMEFEERDGYLAPVEQRMPCLFEAVERVRGEHPVLQSRIAQILADARTQPGVYAFREELSQRLRQWLDSMHNHERRENALIQEAFNTDIGTCD